MMSSVLINLASVQLYKLCKSVLDVPCSDSRKESFKNELAQLCTAVSLVDATSIGSSDLQNHYTVINILSEIASSLDGHNAYVLSKELRALIMNLISRWIDNPAQYVLSATDGVFSYTSHYEDWDGLNKYLKIKYGHSFSSHIITVKVPKNLHEDYFYAGALYHEVGHFIDAYYSIYIDLVDEVKNQINVSDITGNLIDIYFPRINEINDSKGNPDVDRRKKILENHCKEYIADLFGAQYLGDTIFSYADYLTFMRKDESSDTHPSWSLRKRLIDDFEGSITTNELLNIITRLFSDRKRPLAKRYILLDSAKMKKGESITIASDDELHSLIYNLWLCWKSGKDDYEKSMAKSITMFDYYNALIAASDKSVSDYLAL